MSKFNLTYLLVNGRQIPIRKTPKSGPATEPLRTIDAANTPSKLEAKKAIPIAKIPKNSAAYNHIGKYLVISVSKVNNLGFHGKQIPKILETRPCPLSLIFLK